VGKGKSKVNVLIGHHSPETARVVDDYPYGFRLRCKIRYWVETADKGAMRGKQRFVSQTTNPKVAGEVWNKPKSSTYDDVVIMALGEEDHVTWASVSTNSAPSHIAKVRNALKLLGESVELANVMHVEQWSRRIPYYAAQWAEVDAESE
jgi:hypothetical protein